MPSDDPADPPTSREGRLKVIAAALGVVGVVLGAGAQYVFTRWHEEERAYLSTKRKQLAEFYAPMEILVRINKREFDRYTKAGTTEHDRIFIEQNVWKQNNTAIREIVFSKAHLLDEVPDSIIDLMIHINVWLSEYDLVYVKREKDPPVFAGPKGYGWPTGVDDYIIDNAAELRAVLRE